MVTFVGRLVLSKMLWNDGMEYDEFVGTFEES